MANVPRRNNMGLRNSTQTIDEMMDRERNRVPNAHEIVRTGISDTYRQEALNTLGDRLLGVAINHDTIQINDSAFVSRPVYSDNNQVSGGERVVVGGGGGAGNSGGEAVGAGGGGGYRRIRGVSGNQIFSDELDIPQDPYAQDRVNPHRRMRVDGRILGIAIEGIQAGQAVSIGTDGRVNLARADDHTTVRPDSPLLNPENRSRRLDSGNDADRLSTTEAVMNYLNQEKNNQIKNDEISMLKGAMLVLGLEDTHSNRELVKRKMLANADPGRRVKFTFQPEEKSKGDRWGDIWSH